MQDTHRRPTKRPAADTNLGSATKRFTAHISQSSSQRQLLTAQSHVTELQNTLLEKQATIDRLEADRRWLAEREEKERTTREKEASEWEEERQKLSERLSDVQHKLAEVDDAYGELKDAFDVTVQQSRKEVSELKAQLTEERNTVAALEHDLHARQQDEGPSFVFDDREDSSAPQPNSADNDIIRAELHRQSSYTRTLEATNARLNAQLSRLRQRAENADILYEENLSLKRKVEVTEALRSRVAELELEVSSQASAPQPQFSLSQLVDLQKEHARLLDKHGEVNAQLRATDLELSSLRSENASLSSTATSLRSELDKAKQSFSSTQTEEHLSLNLARQEIVFLKSLVASYTEEASDNQGARVAQLESLLQEYKDTLQTDKLQKRAEEAESQVEVLEKSKRTCILLVDLTLYSRPCYCSRRG